MSIEDDVALLERVPTLRLLGKEALRMLAIGSEQRDTPRGEVLFALGEEADCGYVVERGTFRVDDGAGAETIVGQGALMIRIARSLFQRVLESDPDAARRLRDEFASRTSQIASSILMAGAKLSI
jgi:CRP-like cAMP-binding protein